MNTYINRPNHILNSIQTTPQRPNSPGSGSVELLQSLLDAARLVPSPSLLGAALVKAAEAKQRSTTRSSEKRGTTLGKKDKKGEIRMKLWKKIGEIRITVEKTLKKHRETMVKTIGNSFPTMDLSWEAMKNYGKRWFSVGT